MSLETFIAEVVRRRHDLAQECNENAEDVLRSLATQHGLVKQNTPQLTPELDYFLSQVRTEDPFFKL